MVLDDIFLAAGFGPECGYFFEVSDGSLIECDYTGVGTYYTENSYEIFDSEGNSVALVMYSDWSGVATCPGTVIETETYEPSYYWTFEPLYHSNEKTIGYPFSSPGDYDVTLRARGNNLGTMKAGVTGLQTSFHNMWSNFMFDFAHCDIDVSNPGAPLGANADGGNLGGYETIVNVPITLHGTATGGTAPYIYEWDFGNDQTAVSEGPDKTT